MAKSGGTAGRVNPTAGNPVSVGEMIKARALRGAKDLAKLKVKVGDTVMYVGMEFTIADMGLFGSKHIVQLRKGGNFMNVPVGRATRRGGVIVLERI